MSTQKIVGIFYPRDKKRGVISSKNSIKSNNRLSPMLKVCFGGSANKLAVGVTEGWNLEVL